MKYKTNFDETYDFTDEEMATIEETTGLKGLEAIEQFCITLLEEFIDIEESMVKRYVHALQKMKKPRS